MAETHRGLVVLLFSLLGALLPGCADGPTTLNLAPGQYLPAIDAARAALRDHGFTVDRVDAAAGVITSHPKATAGLATPWDVEQSTVYQEWEDFMNRHERTVRIQFEPAEDSPQAAAPRDAKSPLPDLTLDPPPLVMHTIVEVDRAYRSNWRIDSSDIRRSRFYWDRDLSSRGMLRYEVPIRRDDKLAARLTKDIQRRLE